ncbi:DUF4231 domain-containing protein [Hymenobacter properus]|uniref:DUF4231 domain-containing protein n=1 Tax=Hymenobacter properus TaxID=2791026 RepID=A0A931FJT1_9BACT|nr:DUF4231 domain-containing protein [Hymenobacter properus]MBF9140895.1 DUF4231 domain-containing protein [Hymenobacter properus]MBR7719704.1 DUF4231 domain-containing protein [Microvirga sp. SRT04]
MKAPEHTIPLYVALDAAANEAQQTWRRRYIQSLVVLGIIAAVVAGGELLRHYLAPNTQVLKFSLISLTTIGALGLLYEVQYAVRHHHRFGRWIHVRAVAEQLKSRAWLLLAGAEEPTNHPHVAEADWRKVAQRIIDGGAAPSLSPYLAMPALQTARQHFVVLPLEQQVQWYRQHRLHEQQHYFSSRLASLIKRNRRHHYVALALLIIALAWAFFEALDIAFDWHTIFRQYNLTSVLIAVIALHKAYTTTEKTESLLSRYQHMVTELAAHIAAPAPATSDDFKHWVRSTEKLLLTQTREWQLQRAE